MMKTTINWKIFWILWIASILSVFAVLPYSLSLTRDALRNLDGSIPLPALIATQVIQSAILFTILIWAGLFFARRVGLGLPLLESALRGETVTDKFRGILPISVILGVLGTLILLAVELFYFQPALTQELGKTANALNLQTSQPAAWKGLLASFYGGIAEEILLRLFLMSFLVWLGKLISRTAEVKPSGTFFWAANILAAILFGIGHLPTTSLLVPLTPLVITRALVLNGLLGVIFGWLYWKHGLESAMISHFSADIVLHVLLAL